ncbi:MAG: hypothetical protein KDD47_20570, partial [Acidobacteria bacterium]|nr:hypothetical protein [Acidobacteriota bacterium]
DGTYRPLVPGKQVPFYENVESVRLAEEASGRELTPAEVSSFWARRALTWARDEPGAFLRLQLVKLRRYWSWYELPDSVDYYCLRDASPVLWFPWPDFGALTLLAAFGVVARRRRLLPFLPTLVFLGGWTAATVAFFIFSRYRLPVVPALALLAAVPVAGVAEAAGRGRRKQALLGCLGVLVAIALPRIPSYETREDLVSYNLGRLYQEHGESETARRHFLEALHHDPRNFLACLNLGLLAVEA